MSYENLNPVFTNSKLGNFKRAFFFLSFFKILNDGYQEIADEIFDLYYVRNWSLKLDWLVFYKTIAIVLGFQRPDDSVRAPKMTDDQIIKE